MVKRIIWMILIGCFAQCGTLLAQQIYSNDFLNIGVGARSLGMGRAVVSTESSIQAAYWNPANFSTGEGPVQLSAMHAIWFAGVVNYDYLGVGFRMGADQKAYGGVSMIRMGIDDIPNTLHLYGPDGRINYANIRSFSVADYAFLFTYGRQLGNSDWRIGGNVKLIRRVLGSFAKSWGGGLDLSVAYTGDNLRFGVVLRDASTTFNAWSYNFTEDEIEILQNLGNTVPESAQEVIRPSMTPGVSYTYRVNENLDATLAMDLEVTFDGRRNTLIQTDGLSMEPHLGLELSSRDILFLRAGVSSIQSRKKINNPDANEYFVQPNMGIGLQLGRIGIDYALAFLNESDGKSSLSHVFSASYTLQGREE